MSQEAFVDFYENYLNTPEGASLREQIDAHADRAAFSAAAVEAGRERGFDFSLEDVRAVMKASEAAMARQLAAASGELSEDQLEGVAGGAELSSYAIPRVIIRSLPSVKDGALSANTIMCSW